MSIHEVMPTKTISLEVDAYEKLKRAKRFPRESFSEVVRRLPIPQAGISGADLIAMSRESGPCLDEADLESIDALNAGDEPPSIP